MKLFRVLSVVGALALALPMWNTLAQRGDRTDPPKDPMPVKPERPKIEWPAPLKEAIEAARKAHQDFIAAQLELRKQLKDATAETRDQLREQLKTQREKFVEEQKARAKEIQVMIKEMRERFKNNRDTVTDAAKEEVKKRSRR